HDLLLARADRDLLGVALASSGKIPARCQDALQLVGIRALMVLEPALEPRLQNLRVCIRCNWQRIVVVVNDKTAVSVDELQFLALEDGAVLIAEDRDEHLISQL